MNSLEKRLKELTDSVESYEQRSRNRAIFFSLVLPAALFTLYIGLSIWQVNQLEQKKLKLEAYNKKLQKENIALIQATKTLTKNTTEAKRSIKNAKEELDAINHQLNQAKRSSSNQALQNSLLEIERRSENLNSAITTAAKDLERYQKTSCGSILDSRTGLEWYIGPDRNMNWNEASKWVDSLTACGVRWRMPKIEELKPLYSQTEIAGKGYFTGGQYFPARMAPVFNEIGGGSWVWADEESQGNAFNFHENIAVMILRNNPEQLSVRAFAVRTR